MRFFEIARDLQIQDYQDCEVVFKYIDKGAPEI